MINLLTTLEYDLAKEDQENIQIDYRNSNYKTILITLPITQSQITLNQDFKLGKGGIFWDSSFFITQYLIDTIYPIETSPSSKWVLELGAGTALPSISSLIKGYNTIITDIPKLIPFCKEIIDQNKALYNPLAQYNVHQLSWKNETDKGNVKKIKEKFDIIIGSELIYLDDLFDDLINTLAYYSNEKTLVLMSYKIRLQSMADEFISKVKVFFDIKYIDNEYKNSIDPLKDKLQMIQLIKKL